MAPNIYSCFLKTFFIYLLTCGFIKYIMIFDFLIED